MNNKGQMGNLTTGAIALVTAAVMVGLGAFVLMEIQEKVQSSAVMGVNSTSSAVLGNGTEGLASFGKFLPIIAVVVAAAVILGLIAGGFMLRR